MSRCKGRINKTLNENIKTEKLSEQEIQDALQDWKETICKPYWEIEYCPYGPLVEDFPLKEERDQRSCKIFGHDCPVFKMAEPVAEPELRSDDFKDQSLGASCVDDVMVPVDFGMVECLFDAALYSHRFRGDNGSLPDGSTIAEGFEVGEATEFENDIAQIIRGMDEFFTGEAQSEMPPEHFEGLKFRWGWLDGSTNKVAAVVEEFSLSPDELLEAELDLLRRLGWITEFSVSDKERWLKS